MEADMSSLVNSNSCISLNICSGDVIFNDVSDTISKRFKTRKITEHLTESILYFIEPFSEYQAIYYGNLALNVSMEWNFESYKVLKRQSNAFKLELSSDVDLFDISGKITSKALSFISVTTKLIVSTKLRLVASNQLTFQQYECSSKFVNGYRMSKLLRNAKPKLQRFNFFKKILLTRISQHYGNRLRLLSKYHTHNWHALRLSRNKSIKIKDEKSKRQNSKYDKKHKTRQRSSSPGQIKVLKPRSYFLNKQNNLHQLITNLFNKSSIFDKLLRSTTSSYRKPIGRRTSVLDHPPCPQKPRINKSSTVFEFARSRNMLAASKTKGKSRSRSAIQVQPHYSISTNNTISNTGMSHLRKLSTDHRPSQFWNIYNKNKTRSRFHSSLISIQQRRASSNSSRHHTGSKSRPRSRRNVMSNSTGPSRVLSDSCAPVMNRYRSDNKWYMDNIVNINQKNHMPLLKF